MTLFYACACFIMLCFSAGISIATPLMSVVVSSGSTAMFTIILSTPGLSSIVNFDWRMGASSVMNGGQVSGADTNMLTISNVDTSHEGEYRVRILRFSPEFCSTTSPTVTLAIRELYYTCDTSTYVCILYRLCTYVMLNLEFCPPLDCFMCGIYY